MTLISKHSSSARDRSFVSILLIIEPQANHHQQLLKYLAWQQLLPVSQSQLESGNIPNLHLYNDNQEGVKIRAVRELIQESSFSSYNQNPRVFAILNAQQSSIPAQNALLKIIEEPPQNSIIILTSAYPKQLLATIRSRCIKVELKTDDPNQDQLNQLPLLSQQEIEAVANQITDKPNFSFSQAIELAEKYKQREIALELIIQLINFFHHQITNQSINGDTLAINKITGQLLKAYQDLQQNLNVSLALEHHFFEIAKHLTQTKSRAEIA